MVILEKPFDEFGLRIAGSQLRLALCSGTAAFVIDGDGVELVSIMIDSPIRGEGATLCNGARNREIYSAMSLPLIEHFGAADLAAEASAVCDDNRADAKRAMGFV